MTCCVTLAEYFWLAERLAGIDAGTFAQRIWAFLSPNQPYNHSSGR